MSSKDKIVSYHYRHKHTKTSHHIGEKKKFMKYLVLIKMYRVHTEQFGLNEEIYCSVSLQLNKFNIAYFQTN